MCCFLGVLIALSVLPEVSGAAVQVIGEGTSFPLIEIEQWRADVALPPYNLQIVYNGTSSGQGREEFKNGRVDFGVSDIPYPPGTEPGFAFSYVPLSAGGIAFMFNLEDVAGRRVTDLKLTATTACKIFTGQITKWTDREIVADNPKFSVGYLSNDKVKVIMRSGAAGTSFILGDYCEKLAPAVWRQFTIDGPGFGGGVPWSNHPGPPLSQWPAPPVAPTPAVPTRTPARWPVTPPAREPSPRWRLGSPSNGASRWPRCRTTWVCSYNPRPRRCGRR